MIRDLKRSEVEDEIRKQVDVLMREELDLLKIVSTKKLPFYTTFTNPIAGIRQRGGDFTVLVISYEVGVTSDNFRYYYTVRSSCWRFSND